MADPLITLCSAHFISDINECTENMDDCAPANSTCDNTPGSFTCTCDAGYTGNGTVCTGEWVYDVMGVVSPNGCGYNYVSIVSVSRFRRLYTMIIVHCMISLLLWIHELLHGHTCMHVHSCFSRVNAKCSNYVYPLMQRPIVCHIIGTTRFRSRWASTVTGVVKSQSWKPQWCWVSCRALNNLYLIIMMQFR